MPKEFNVKINDRHIEEFRRCDNSNWSSVGIVFTHYEQDYEIDTFITIMIVLRRDR